MFKIVFCLFLCSAALPAEWSSLYDASQLEAEKPRLQKSVDYLLEKEIAPFLPAEVTPVFGLQAIDLPLQSSRSNPLDFYSQDGHIVLPVSTLLFIEDLSRSYAWMWSKHFATRTINEYLSMLRYRPASDFPGGRYPAPRFSLHVPEDDLGDPHAVEAALRMRRTAYAFIILHQFAHIQLHHDPKSGRGYSEAQEEDADRYALNIIKNNSVTPTGVLLVMSSGLFFEAGQSDALHPVSAPRLSMMAEFLRGRVTEFVRGRPDQKTAMDGIFAISSLLEDGAQWLSVRGHQEDSQKLAMKTDPGTLQPKPLPRTTR